LPAPPKRLHLNRWLFVDESRNRSRRWCTMEECGTHEKVHRYLERRAAGVLRLLTF
jgi:predicted RNA-binding Zn ribbon-like protein